MAIFGGTGLGLTISQKYLHLMGSELNIVSVVGEGSEFTFTIDLPSAKTKSISRPALLMTLTKLNR
ncbi:MAG: hypothetical protein HRU25_14865 [Psychrobium sp.]|nr:hypothetical protein [Psychrobium sp.]